MITTFRQSHSVVLASAISILLAAGAGCSQKDGATWGSPYSVDHKVVSPNGFYAEIETTIKGPAAKLAVVLTDPAGKSDHVIVEKDQMMSNTHTLNLPMIEPQAGTYVLAVKTVDPEKIVWQKQVTFSAAQLSVKDVTFGFEPCKTWGGNFCGYGLGDVQIALEKSGNLPVKVSDPSFTLDGNTFHGFIDGGMIVESGATLRVRVVGSCPPTKKQIEKNNSDRRSGGMALPPLGAVFDPGERYLVDGKLFYGKDHKCLTFQKELVAPAAPTGSGQK